MTEQYVNKKTRITAHIRDSIIAKALETSGINQRGIDLINNRAAFAEEVRQFAMKQAKLSDSIIRDIEDEMLRKYPKGCHARDFMTINVGGASNFRFNANLNGMNLYFWLDGRDCETSYWRDNENTFLTEAL